MEQRQAVMRQPGRGWGLGFMVLVALFVILVVQSVATGESQPPSAVLSEGYKDPDVRREYMFPEYHDQNIGRTRHRNGFSWDIRITATLPPEYILSGSPRLHQAIVYSSGTATNAAGQTVQLRGKGGLIIIKGKVRTTDRFRIRYRHNFRERGQNFYRVAIANLTYFGEFTLSGFGEVQVFLSDREDIPADFLAGLEQNLDRGSVIVTIMQPDSIDGVPLPPDPIPEPVETATFTGSPVSVTLLSRNNPPELAGARVFSLYEQTRVGRQFWKDNKPATLASVQLFRDTVPGLVRLSFLANRLGRLSEVNRPRTGPGSRTNRNPFLVENAFLTELKIVGRLHTLTLTGRYKDNGRGRIIIPPTDATLSFIDSLGPAELVDVHVTFTLDDTP